MHKVIHHTDNRIYDYSNWVNDNREEYDYILELVKPGSSIVDLGCGNGSLMQRLIREKGCTAAGMEISSSGVDVCISKGLDVIRGSIDQRLPYRENSFDYAICNVTLQMVMFPEMLLAEMKRVARYLVLSFPNFGFYKNRLELLFKGSMPPKALFGYTWFNTGHIHMCSIKDFYSLVNVIGGLNVEQHNFTKTSGFVKNSLMQMFPNLFQLYPVILLKKTD